MERALDVLFEDHEVADRRRFDGWQQGLLVRGDGHGTSGEYFRSAQLGSQYFEQIVCAFVDPVLALHFDPDDGWFAKLVLREAGDPSNQDRPVLKVLFDPMAREFIDAFREALPGKPDGFYQWAYLFSVGALTQGASEDRVRDLTDKTYLEQKHDLLRSCITAALRHG